MDMSIDLELVVAVITIVSSILGVGWRLGQIASGIRLEIAEIKGLFAVSSERIAQVERRVDLLERNKATAPPCRRKAGK
jgi:hypothetical protein